MANLKERPRFNDKISFLYIDKARIEQDTKAVAVYRESGKTRIPCASINTILLGPGTTITHAAITCLANSGCTILWVGEESIRFYAVGKTEPRSSANLLKQVEHWSNHDTRLAVIREMYKMRFNTHIPKDYSLQQLRGLEGARVRTIYQSLAETYGIAWKSRSYNSDEINEAISYANSYLYGLCHSGIVSLGFSPSLGFIHTGQQLSFVYDIADLYKMQTVVPIAFEVIATKQPTENIQQKLRHTCRQYFHNHRTLKQITLDLYHLFHVEKEPPEVEISNLWDNIEAGKNYIQGEIE